MRDFIGEVLEKREIPQEDLIGKVLGEELKPKPFLPIATADVTKTHQMPEPTEGKTYKWWAYPFARVYSTLYERPAWAITELMMKGIEAGANALSPIMPSQKKVAKVAGEAEEYFKHPPVTEMAERTMQQNIAAMYKNKNYVGAITVQVAEATTDLIGLFIHMGLLSGASMPSKAAQSLKAMRALETGKMGTYALKHAAKLGTYAALTRPGSIPERARAAVTMMGYNLTPFITNATGAVGLLAQATDTALNLFITSPEYIKAIRESKDPLEFVSRTIPQFVMDVGMAWNTRGWPVNQRRAAIKRYIEKQKPVVDMDKEEFLKLLDSKWQKLEKEGKIEPAEPIKDTKKATTDLNERQQRAIETVLKPEIESIEQFGKTGEMPGKPLMGLTGEKKQVTIPGTEKMKFPTEFIKPRTPEEIAKGREALETGAPLFEQPGEGVTQLRLGTQEFPKEEKLLPFEEGLEGMSKEKYAEWVKKLQPAKEEKTGETTLYQAIAELGGIRSYKKGIGPGELREEYREVPIFLRRNAGLPLDEMADALKRQYPHFGIEGEADLIGALANYKYMHSGVNLYAAYNGLKNFYMSKIGQPVFDRMNRLVPGFVKRLTTPYYGWNQYVKFLWRDMLYERIGKMSEAEGALKEYLTLNKDDREAVYYLATNKPLPEGKQASEYAVKAAKLVKDEFYKLGEQAVEAGLMSKETFDKRAGEYLPRLFEVYERTKRDPNVFRKSIRLDFQRWMHRSEDLSPEWREAAGEIKNVEELFTKGVMQEVYDITLRKFQERLRALPAEFTSGEKVVMTPKEFDAEVEKGIVSYYKYQRLPNTKEYGSLRDQWIRLDVYDALKGIYRTKGQFDDIARIHKKLITLWKMGKTVFSPATQMRNFYFGLIQCDWGDGWDVKSIADFAVALKTKNQLYKDLKHDAILGSGMARQEMTGYLERLRTADNKIEKVIDVFTDILMEKAKGKYAAQLYQASDDMFRSLVYISHRNKGYTREKARDLANFYMVNYREVSPFVSTMRTGPSPFITFYNGFAQSAAHTAIVKPWKLAKLYLILSALGYTGLREAKEDPELAERKKKAMPQYLPNIVSGLPALRLPWVTKRGEDLYLDMTYVFPFLDMQVEFLQLAKGELKPLHPGIAAGRAAIRFLNHPGLRWMADVAMHGKDPFLGTDLDTPGKIADYTYKQLMPSFAPEIPGITQGGWGYMGIKRAIQQKPSSKRGYVRGVPEAIGRYALGIKTIPVNYTEELDSRIRYGLFLMSEADAQIVKVAEDKSLNEKQKQKQTEELTTEIQRLGDLIKDWQEQKDWFEEREEQEPRDYIGEVLEK